MDTDTDSGEGDQGAEFVDAEEAHDILGGALDSIRRVQNGYPSLTSELEELLEAADGNLTLVYLRLGREGESPSLTELGERYVGIGDTTLESDTDD